MISINMISYDDAYLEKEVFMLMMLPINYYLQQLVKQFLMVRPFIGVNDLP